MKKLWILLAVAAAACSSPDGSSANGAASREDVSRWEARAKDVTIIRDDWGIPHVYGKTDADAVFGVMYAQAEDDFNRVEVNYLNSIGRLAEAEGEGEIYRDLRMKLFIDPDSMRAQYDAAPEWLRALMDAYADGLNFYLHKHPEVKPKVITRFEPWMALTFSEGSIGGDIERVSLRGLEELYGGAPAADQLALAAATDSAARREPRGSNGFAIAPSRTAEGHALLLINPHTSFFFRAEAQMVSEEGLNAYGALTWGQFFIYQGFNDRLGWMHTSSGADNIDEYLETVTKKDGQPMYRYGDEERPVTVQRITVPFRTDSGMASREFTVYRTHHGPVVREQDGKWVSVRMMQEPLKALTQSYTRTKARSYDEFMKSMELHTNSSNNTLYADADGNIAYLHSNFVPRRDVSFDWSRPVDGSNPATEWQGIHTVEESPNVINPSNGWVQNTNNWPYSAAGANSPKERDFPSYFDRNGENPRGIHAVRVLQRDSAFTLASLIQAAFDPELPAFEKLIPALIRNYDALPASSPLRAKLEAQVDSLRGWDMRWSATSVPTSLAVFFGEDLMQRIGRDAAAARVTAYDYMDNRATAAQRLASLEAASDKLAADFGKWETPWGEINRFQRLTGDIVQEFDDSKPSIAVPFTSARWGSLASFGARQYPQTRKWYGTSGNSFVAVVQFGDSVRARAVSAGGESGDPASPHFDDQATRYASGDLRDVYFYRSQLTGHTQREYHPGK